MSGIKKITKSGETHASEKRILYGKQRGFLLVAAIVLIVVLAFFGVAVTYMFVGDATGSTGHLSSAQALFIAESGIEFEQRSLAQNVDWYRSTSDPTATTTNNVGQGSFSVFHNLPATELTKRMNAGSAADINVFTTLRFATPFPPATPSLWLLIDDDPAGNGEFVSYTGTTATTFTGVTRYATVGTVTSTAGTAHNRGDNVYPVTTLGVALTGGAGNCPTVPNPFTITYHPKFLSAGTITVFHFNGVSIDHEEITYSSATANAAHTTITLSGVQRCQNTLTPTAIAAAVGDPVAPIVANVGDKDFEAEIVSIGTANGAQRQEYKTVQRQQ